MYELTFLACGAVRSVTTPSFWVAYWLRRNTRGARLWTKKDANGDRALIF